MHILYNGLLDVRRLIDVLRYMILNFTTWDQYGSGKKIKTKILCILYVIMHSLYKENSYIVDTFFNLRLKFLRKRQKPISDNYIY